MKQLIQTIKLQNFLSYGPKRQEIELQPLNVLIGANGSGKSNLIEAFSFLKATPTDIMVPIRKGGGTSEFLWKGQRETPTANIEAILNYPTSKNAQSLHYNLAFTESNQRFLLADELVKYQDSALECYHYQHSRGAILRAINEENHFEPTYPNQSIFSQRKEPDRYHRG